MTDKKENTTNDNTKKRDQEQKGSLKDIIDGKILTRDAVVRQFPFIFFLTLLAIVFIWNRYSTEKIIKETELLKKDRNELRSESITKKSVLMSLSKQSKVATAVNEKGLGLSESIEPPKKIIIYKK